MNNNTFPLFVKILYRYNKHLKQSEKSFFPQTNERGS
jgi:hypothetical protein